MFFDRPIPPLIQVSYKGPKRHAKDVIAHTYAAKDVIAHAYPLFGIQHTPMLVTVVAHNKSPYMLFQSYKLQIPNIMPEVPCRQLIKSYG